MSKVRPADAHDACRWGDFVPKVRPDHAHDAVGGFVPNLRPAGAHHAGLLGFICPVHAKLMLMMLAVVFCTKSAQLMLMMLPVWGLLVQRQPS